MQNKIQIQHFGSWKRTVKLNASGKHDKNLYLSLFFFFCLTNLLKFWILNIMLYLKIIYQRKNTANTWIFISISFITHQ